MGERYQYVRDMCVYVFVEGFFCFFCNTQCACRFKFIPVGAAKVHLWMQLSSDLMSLSLCLLLHFQPETSQCEQQGSESIKYGNCVC